MGKVLTTGEAAVRKFDGILIITIVATLAASSLPALAKEGKASSHILKNTATGKHYDKATLAPKKSGSQGSG
ncbi:MAG: hypothetical protein WBG10_05820, partial [Pseudolabrys sp.]